MSKEQKSDACSGCSLSNHAFIERVDRQSIIAIALSVHRQTLPLNTEILCTLEPDVAMGSFNAVWFINFHDDVQWVFRTPFLNWSPALEKRLRSDILGVQLIQSKTTIPIPRIIHHSVSQDNLFGRPYIIMERVKGVPVHDLWFDPTWFSEEKRRNIFRSLTSIMSQLQMLEFTQIGSIYLEEDKYIVGPLLPPHMVIEDGSTEARGPYNTVHSFLMDTIAHSTLAISIKASLRLLSGCIPDETLDGPPFVLSMPDYDSQNVYIDNDGNMTGLLDWDDIIIGPRQAGFSRYPLWLMRDIEVDMNGFDFIRASWEEEPSFPQRDEIKQDWPETMPVYRNEFLDALKEVDPGNVGHCRNSHLVTPIMHEMCSILHFGKTTYNVFDQIFLMDDGSSGILMPYIFECGARRGEWIKQFVQ